MAFRVLNALRLIDISNNLGDSKTLACHPGSTVHSSISAEERACMGIAEGSIRLSVGLEDVEDLKADLDQALGRGCDPVLATVRPGALVHLGG